jgi:hypothetical protein
MKFDGIMSAIMNWIGNWINDSWYVIELMILCIEMMARWIDGIMLASIELTEYVIELTVSCRIIWNGIDSIELSLHVNGLLWVI